tara:strand:+ start:4587 stop:5543 length:957 start_codon:yes stop_codon:yes gene_type:complete
MLPNYLILTPDGVGSTYLQRALTVYLHSTGLDYWNTHELLNGLGLSEGNLYKDWNFSYSQTIPKICKLLESTNNNLVSRIAQYHITCRLENNEENYQQLYDACNNKFDKIFYCVRDPFEYALSWSIRRNTNVLNVYNIKERINVHGEDTKQMLDLAYFNRKLEQYSAYEYWAEDNFDITRAVDYDDNYKDVDSMMTELTGLDNSVKDKFGVSLQDYSTVRYMTSMYMQTKDKKYLYNKDHAVGTLQLKRFIQTLVPDKLPNEIPIKMNTMQDKQKRVINFDDAVDVYNRWATTTNSHMPISQEDIAQRISTESKIYAT